MTYKWEAIAQDLTEERDRLQKELKSLRPAAKMSVFLEHQCQGLLAENERLREALKFYANALRWNVQMLSDSGKVAREALNEKE